jgi:hypothetical protein
LHWIIDATKTKHNQDNNGDGSHDDLLSMQLTIERVMPHAAGPGDLVRSVKIPITISTSRRDYK